MTRIHSLIVALCLALPALSVAAEPKLRLGPAPVLGGGSYSTGGGITVAIEPRATQDGRLALCGVWAESRRLSAYLRGRAPAILGTASLAVNGESVVSNLGFLPQAPAARSYAGAEARCAVTVLPYTGAERVEIRIPRQVVLRDRGGPEIRFGPPERENPALGSGTILPPGWTGRGG